MLLSMPAGNVFKVLCRSSMELLQLSCRAPLPGTLQSSRASALQISLLCTAVMHCQSWVLLLA